ncbi:uncharacterized protein LOC119384816 [Rhipicephalus sanguineus]|uniref:uncharacterized protein LOC119384816 n=1 Tax=Rhipicephalus sanguineus TaxID=34632 RepID=UPI0018930FFF|nr:uncharacterized protein LOC119384816 [Rhipicephalus sanguineus]
MNSFLWLVVVFAAASAHRDFPVRPWTGSQLVRALGNGHVCETIPADARVNDTRRVTSDQWPDDAWWSWFELYGGRFTCSDQGIRKDGDCLFTSRDKSHAVCFLDFSRIRMRYSLRVAVRNPKRGDEPLALIEAGNVTASAKSAEARLQVEKHSDGRFHIAALDLGRVKIKKLVFRKSTANWNGKKIDTMDPLFRDPIRHALSDLAHAFINGPLLDQLKKAFDDAREHP